MPPETRNWRQKKSTQILPHRLKEKAATSFHPKVNSSSNPEFSDASSCFDQKIHTIKAWSTFFSNASLWLWDITPSCDPGRVPQDGSFTDMKKQRHSKNQQLFETANETKKENVHFTFQLKTYFGHFLQLFNTLLENKYVSITLKITSPWCFLSTHFPGKKNPDSTRSKLWLPDDK